MISYLINIFQRIIVKENDCYLFCLLYRNAYRSLYDIEL